MYVLLAVEPSLPMMAVVALVSAVASASVTGTLAVAAFLRRQRDNSRGLKTLHERVDGVDEKSVASEIKALRTDVGELERWKPLSERKHSALKKSLADEPDHLVHRLWPDSK